MKAMTEEFSTARDALLNAAIELDSMHLVEARDHIRTLLAQCEAIAERIEELLLLDACKKLTARRG
jgi:uncharacterized Zn finger protein